LSTDAIDYACPQCGVPPGERCRRGTGSKRPLMPIFHVKRTNIVTGGVFFGGLGRTAGTTLFRRHRRRKTLKELTQ